MLNGTPVISYTKIYPGGLKVCHVSSSTSLSRSWLEDHLNEQERLASPSQLESGQDYHQLRGVFHR